MGLAIAIAIAVCWLAFEGAPSRVEEGRVIELRTQAAAPVAPIVSELAHEDHEAALPENRVLEDEPIPDSVGGPIEESNRVPIESPAATSEPLRVGRILLQVSDPTPLGPLRWFDARIANAKRFAKRRSGWMESEIELPLRPDVYALLVLSPGYEPQEIPSIEVQSGEIVPLVPIVLRPGSGRIQVRVTGALDPRRELALELLGEGRHPCARCGVLDDTLALARRADEAARGRAERSPSRVTAPVDRAWTRSGACPECGFARERSRAGLPPGGTFTFTHLASGAYALRLVDREGQTIGEPRQLTLDEGATASVVIDGAATRTLELELFDVNGQSLMQEWSRRIAAAKSNVEIVEGVSVRDSADALEFVVVVERREWSRTTFVPPSLAGHRRVRPTAFSGRRLGTSTAQNPARDVPIDGPRRASDSLHPEVKAPFFEPVTVQCEIGEQGFVTLGPLPSGPLQLSVVGAQSAGEAFVRASSEATRVRVYLHPR